MNKDEAKFRVRMETDHAKRDMEELEKSGSKTAKAIRKGIANVVSAGVRYTGAGIAFGAGLEAVKSGAMSGVSDVFGEAFGGWGAQLQHWALGDLVPEARASSQARDATISAFATVAGIKNQIPPEARTYFNQTKSLMLEREKGVQLFETDQGMRGPGIGEIIDKIMHQLAQIATDAVEALGKRLLGSWFG